MTTNVQQPAWQADDLRPVRRWLLLLVALPLLALIAVLAFVIFQPIKVLPRISLAPGFSFTDQDGNRLTSEDLRGKLTLYNFTYSHCDASCPQTSSVMAAVQDSVASMDTGALPVEFVTLSVDPDRDTPERLRDYAAELDADTRTWHFLTGDPDQLKNVIGGGFDTYYAPTDDGAFAVDPVFILVDGWGIKRAIYRTAEPDLAVIKRDIGLIAEEVKNNTGINRYAYEAAHLFLCYPD